MPVRRNTYYNDPALAKVAAGLGSLFAAPSGADEAAWASANAKRAETDRLSQLFSIAGSPDYNPTTFDRQAVAAGLYTPTQSYYAQDQNNGTAIRGQDVTAATTRRGQDITAATSRANNADDNTRILQTNQLDNNRNLVTSLYGALKPGEVAPAVDADILSAAGFGTFPAIPQRQGLAPTMSKEQVEGAATVDILRKANDPNATPEQRQAANALLARIITGNTGVEKTVQNGKTVLAPGGVAALSGAEVRPTDTKLVEGTALINGKATQVYRDPTSPVYRTAEGTPIPPDIQVFDTAKPTGTSEQLGMKPTEFTTRNGMFYNRAAPAASIMEELMTGNPTQGVPGYRPSALDFEAMLGGAGDKLPLSITNNVVSPEGRQFYNSAMGFMMAVLRPDTGAAFGKEEFQNYAKVFIPLPGDDPRTLANKKVARDTALAALQGSSAGAADQITRMMVAQGVPIPQEMMRNMEIAKQVNQQQPGVTKSMAPAAPATTTPATDPLASARAAIARGANREAVIQRLRQNGVDPAGL